MLKSLIRKIFPNPLDQLLKKARKENKQKILITWNRGLGDIALGLYALVFRIRSFIQDAEITFVTRSDLKEGFALLKGVSVIVGLSWKRGSPFNLEATLKEHGLSKEKFDLILENPDPTNWLSWQLGKLTPRLTWESDWDKLAERFGLEKGCIGVHVQTETVYGYEKNWPVAYWQDLFSKLTKENKQVVLFGFKKDSNFDREGIIDLRGETTLYEMLSIIKNYCCGLVVPDSGVLSLTYYLDAHFPIRIVSLWADPRQGVLKQKVPSPNSGLEHFPLIGKEENVANISVEEALEALFTCKKN